MEQLINNNTQTIDSKSLPRRKTLSRVTLGHHGSSPNFFPSNCSKDCFQAVRRPSLILNTVPNFKPPTRKTTIGEQCNPTITAIPDICHFFSTYIMLVNKIFHTEKRKSQQNRFATKQRKLQTTSVFRRNFSTCRVTFRILHI